jgi:hypothetical protein
MMTAATGFEDLLKGRLELENRIAEVLLRVPVNQDLFVRLQATDLFRLVVGCILLQRVLDVRERRCRPIERWDIDLQDGSAMSSVDN